MSQPKVYEFAKELGLETLTLMDKIRKWGLPVKSHMATLDEATVSEIRKLLDEEGAAKEGNGKVAKKKVAKKKVAKKVTVKKPVTAKSKEEGGKAATTTKKVVRAKTVIRRKAGQVEAEKAAAEEAAAAAQAAQQENLAAVESAGVDESVMEGAAAELAPSTAELSEGQSPETSTGETTERRPRGRIIGRMDLTRITPPARTPSSSQAAPPSTLRHRATGPRNLRTGFVAPDPIIDTYEEDRLREEEERRRNEEKIKRRPTALGDGTAQKFTAAEFRKREVIFQPKKKKALAKGEAKKTLITVPKASKRVVKVYETMTVGELAQHLGIKAPQLIKKLMGDGVMANINTELDFDTISLVVPEFGFEAEAAHYSDEELLQQSIFGDIDGEKVTRPPVVTVMGHVDHGKTTLLDAIRHADVASGEAGGITQHIGAYKVKLDDNKEITFIDTPGHEAFTAMRARGANVTDIAIIVVAADDGVMPQTAEAINHAKAAGVPIIVAVNKMDRPGANPDRIKQQLTEYELVPEEWGGNTIFCPVSALKREGIKELLEQIHLLAEIQELKANPNRSASGIVIESRLEKGRGNVATVLVKEGTLKVGDNFVAGTVVGRVRSLSNDKGESVKEALPSDPVEVMGFSETPMAGDRFDTVKDEASALKIANLRLQKKNAEEKAKSSGVSLEELFSKIKAGDVKELSLVLKADVAGSIEAIKGMFDKLQTDEVKVKVIHSAVGGITESDVLLAATAKGLIIGFNVRPDTTAVRAAREKGVEIKTYNIIYNLIDDIKQAMAGMLKPSIVEVAGGRAEVRDTFVVPKVGTIAGCSVVDGKITRNNMLRLVRDGRVIYEGRISSLKRFKDDVKEVASGYECGIGIENFNDIKVGDVIEAYSTEEVARQL